MKAVKIISIINQGGEYSMAVTYNEVDDDGNIVRRNEKAPVYYAVGEVLEAVAKIESDAKRRIGD